MKVNEWTYKDSALILTLEYVERLRDTIPGVLAITSGGFDPIHPGHISLIVQIKNELRSTGLVSDDIPITSLVLVNDDGFLTRKKGKPFMNLQTRCMVVAGLRNVDMVVPWVPSNGTDMHVNEALTRLRPNFFIKGGDRVDEKSIPEWSICSEIGCKIVSGVGLDKSWSSSELIKKYEMR